MFPASHMRRLCVFSALLSSISIFTRPGLGDETATSEIDGGVIDQAEDCSNPEDPNCDNLARNPSQADGKNSNDAGLGEDSPNTSAEETKEQPFRSKEEAEYYSEYCVDSPDPNCGKYESQNAESSEVVKKCAEWELVESGTNDICDDPEVEICKTYVRGECKKWIFVEKSAESTEDDDYPVFSLLINPADMIFAPLVYNVFPLIINLNFAGRYVGLDLRPMLFFYSGGKTCGGAIAGPRILPMGRGLHGFYMLASIGATSIPESSDTSNKKTIAALMLLFELGYTWHIKHFVVGIGAGLSVIRGGGATSLGFGPNLSIGVGG